jgi:heptosyltransferase-3
MDPQAGILDLLKIQGEQALQRSRRAVIIQPGAIGDCILTLPLAQFIISHLKVGAVDMLGRAEYISYFPGRTCIDTIRAIDCVDMHRLFCSPADFQLTKRDPLIDAFAGYSWIVSFLGQPESDFEQNLIFTANCSQSVETIILPLQPPSLGQDHITNHYIRRLCESCSLKIPAEYNLLQTEPLIRPTSSDRQIGTRLIQQAGIDPDIFVVVLCPGSGGLAKCWHLDNFLALAEQLKSMSIQPLFLLGPAELERLSPRQIIDISRTAPSMTDLSLTEVLQMLVAADAYIGNDSGITHLAAAIGLDTVAFFGPTDSTVYRPPGPKVCVFEDKSPAFASELSEVLQRRVLRKLGEICA